VGPGKFATENLEGDDSRIIMDRALTFIKHAAKKKSPFLSVIWFHTPHTPVVAGPQYLAMYPGFDENRQHYFGCITAMDEQIGRLRRELKQLGIADNTIIFFASDNGPAGEGGGILQYAGQRQQGSAGLFRGRKGSLYEGGIRVPALLEWPARFKAHRKVDVPISTNDYFPSIMSLLGYKAEGNKHPLDGVNFLKLIEQDRPKRLESLGFRLYKQRAYIDEQYKIYSLDDGMHYELYDLLNDPYEKSDIANSQPAKVEAMKTALENWIDSCIKSEQGADY
jgi:arylsulfatase A-like enzyme